MDAFLISKSNFLPGMPYFFRDNKKKNRNKSVYKILVLVIRKLIIYFIHL